NDLQSLSTKEIASNICEMAHIGRQHVRECCIVISVPNCYPDLSYAKYRDSKCDVNRRLKEYVEKIKDESVPRVYFLDLNENNLNIDSMDEDEKTLIYDDSIHYTPEGYSRLGTAVFNVIKSHLSKG
ncbi:unnamed protein product, partial [Didymodactylos carnosus]